MAQPETQPPAWLFSGRTGLLVLVSFVAGLAFVLQLALVVFASTSNESPTESLDDPIRALAMVSEIERRSEVAAAELPPFTAELIYGVDEDARAEVAADWDGLVATFEGEANPEESARARLAKDVAMARWGDEQARARVLAASDEELEALPSVLAGSSAEAALETPAGGSFAPALLIWGARLVLVTLGIVIAALWFRRGRPEPRVRSSRALRGFGLGRGVLVFVWLDGMLVLALVAVLIVEVASPAWSDYAWSVPTLLSLVPVALATRALLARPAGVELGELWRPEPGSSRSRGWRTILLAAAVLFAVDSSFESVVGAAAEAAGYDPAWHAYVDETMMWGPNGVRTLSVLDAVIGAAVVEELVFRGVLFGALRERMETLPAALLSGLLFGLVHGYEPVGLAVVSFSGFVYALTYERTGSLAPCVLVHGVSNLLASAGMLSVPAILGGS